MRRIESERFSVPKPITYCDKCLKQVYINLVINKEVHMEGEEACTKVRVRFKKHPKASELAPVL